VKQIAVLGDTLVGGKVFGIQRFAYEILREIDKMNPDTLTFTVVVPEHSEINVEFENIKIVKYGKIKNPFFWRQLCFTAFLRKQGYIGVDLTLGLPYLGCDVVCLHDCTYENYKANFITFKEKLKRYSYLIRAKRNAKKSKAVLTVSENSKNELVQYYRISPEKISIVYNAWQHYERINVDESIFGKIGITKNDEYFFSLGSGLPHKNLKWIVNAAIKNPKYIFVVTGSNKFSDYLEKIGLEKVDNIIYTGYISDGEVKALMSHCKAFIHPAFCEGFGIPPLEALACGADIIISNTSCLPEIYGESAIYIDPYNYDVNIDSIYRVVDYDKNNVLDNYSWKKSAETILEVMKGL